MGVKLPTSACKYYQNGCLAGTEQCLNGKKETCEQAARWAAWENQKCPMVKDDVCDHPRLKLLLLEYTGACHGNGNCRRGACPTETRMSFEQNPDWQAIATRLADRTKVAA